MPMLTVRLSDEEMLRLKELAAGSSMAQVVKGWIAAPRSHGAPLGVGPIMADERPKPAFLAAPDDDCHKCGHDRHIYAHTNGPCQCPVAPRRKCLCQDYDLGFE